MQLILIGTWGSIIALILGTVFFSVPYLFTPNSPNREYLVKLITDAESDNASLLRRVRQLTESATLNNRNPKALENKAGVPRDDSSILKKISEDSTLFALLSEPPRQRIPTLIQSEGMYLQVLGNKKPGVEHQGALCLLLMELETQEDYLSLEKAHQLGKIGKKEHQERFAAVMNRQAMQLISLVNKAGKDHNQASP